MRDAGQEFMVESWVGGGRKCAVRVEVFFPEGQGAPF